MATKQQRTFDIAEYKEKVKAALAKLEKTQQPGEQTGSGSKTEVLAAAKEEIKAVLAKGYTAKQVADAMKDDVFAILPKTITELVAKKTATKPKAKTVTSKATNTEQNAQRTTQRTPVAGAPEAGSKATFEVKPDRDDL